MKSLPSAPGIPGAPLCPGGPGDLVYDNIYDNIVVVV